MPDSHLSELVKVAFASGTRELNPQLVDRLADIYPELPLYVVSEFAPHRGTWIPYHPYRTWRDNKDACRAALAGKKLRLAAVILVPNMPYRRMRLLALLLSVRGFLAYNENLDSFMLRPRSLPGILRHFRWRIANFFRWHFRAGKPPVDWQRLLASWTGSWLRDTNPQPVTASKTFPSGISVVIPSRNGFPLLQALLPALIEQQPDEVIVVDNGSDDRSTDSIPGIVVERCEAPLSFAQAVNRGIAPSRRWRKSESGSHSSCSSTPQPDSGAAPR